MKDTGEVWQGGTSLGPSLTQNPPQPSFSSLSEEDYLTFFSNTPSQPLAQAVLGKYAEDFLFITLMTTLVFTISLAIVVVGLAVTICKLKSQANVPEEQTTSTENLDLNKNDPVDMLSQFDAFATTLNEKLAELRTVLESGPGADFQTLSKTQEKHAFPKAAERAK